MKARMKSRAGSCLFRGLFLALLLLLQLFSTLTGYAASWPELNADTSLRAEAAAVADADTGTLIYGKNENQREYPASITKVMTALVVLKHCKLTDKVTFSHDAVYNVDQGSSNAQIEEGDVLTVEDCLYAMLLKSANEAANALAEHVAGSRSAFADLMNQEATALGCTGTHFDNPSGLFSENHYTTASDMAKIGIAAMNDERFLKIESHTSYTLPSTKRVPDGLTIYMEHKMLLQNSPYYDKRVIAGKTGYTISSGNTLITMAKDGDRNLVAVVLKDKTPYHYTDTETLLNLGFSETENQEVSGKLVDLSEVCQRLINDTVVSEGCRPSDLHLYGKQIITLPADSDQTGVEYSLDYNLPKDVPESSIARILYTLDGRDVGSGYLLKDASISVILHDTPAGTKAAVAAVTISGITVLIIIAAVILSGGAAVSFRNVHHDRRLRRKMQERRRERLKDLSMSEEELREMVRERNEKKTKNRLSGSDRGEGVQNAGTGWQSSAEEKEEKGSS